MNTRQNSNSSPTPPRLKREADGSPEITSLGDIIEWFLDHDPRVGVIRDARVEEIFQAKQAESKRSGEEVFIFDRAEDRLAIGIVQAIATHPRQAEFHSWIGQLLNALEDSSKTNEEMAAEYELEMGEGSSIMSEVSKISSPQAREVYIACCWLEALCTAEIRVLGWVYQELYGRPYAPN
jgi:hypothetical protein